MLKQNGNFRKWQIVLLVFLLLIMAGCSNGIVAAKKKYPPYPDKWLFEFDFKKFYKHPSCISVVKMDSGDILMMYEKYKGKLLFEDKDYKIDPDHYEEFCRKYKQRKIRYLFGADLSDGTPIYKSGSSKQCYDINPYQITFKGERKYYWIIKVLDEPRYLYDFNRVCDRTAWIEKPYLVEWFDTPTNDIVPLDDNTFLSLLSIYDIDAGYDGRYIVRFDKQMNTRADFFNKDNYFLFEIYEFIEWEEQNGIDFGSVYMYNAQTRIDNIMEYIKTLN